MTDYEDLARSIMFGGKIPVGWEYRKNKTEDDVKKALQRAFKYGHMKTEFELGMFEIYVQKIFKKSKKEL